MTISLPTIIFQLLLIAFKLILDLTYIFFISVFFGYAGFDLNIDVVTYVESWALYLLCISFLQHTMEKPSNFLIFLFLVITVAPMLSMYGLSPQSALYTYFVVLVFLIFILVQRGPDLKIPYIKHGTYLTVFISLCFISIVLIKMAIGGSLFRINFDFSQVYSFRKELGSSLFNGIWSYIVPWMMKIFTIIMIAFALLKKKYFIVFLLIIFQVMLFGITSHKAVAFYPIFAISLYVFKDSKYTLILVIGSLVFFLLICFSSYIFFDDKLLSSYMIRRVFFLPAQLKFQYYDYFSTNGFVYWSHSIFKSFIDYPFSLEPSHLIGSIYHGDAMNSSNTGFIGTSYMNFGFPGMVILGFFVALLIKIVDNFSKGGKPTWFYLSFLSVPFFDLFANAALLTIILTHGLGIALLMAWLTYDQKQEEVSKI